MDCFAVLAMTDGHITSPILAFSFSDVIAIRFRAEKQSIPYFLDILIRVNRCDYSPQITKPPLRAALCIKPCLHPRSPNWGARRASFRGLSDRVSGRARAFLRRERARAPEDDTPSDYSYETEATVNGTMVDSTGIEVLEPSAHIKSVLALTSTESASPAEAVLVKLDEFTRTLAAFVSP